MPEDSKRRPHVFISYCWDNPKTVERVHDFADFLDASNVHVEMDRYQKPGSSLYKFMERMVTDPEIDRVLCFLDRAYMAKAALGKGGVGTETTIITPEVYRQAAQNEESPRFVPIVLEDPPSEGPGIPPMFGTTLYMPMTDTSKDDKHKMQLLNLSYGRPAFQRTENAITPPHLREQAVVFDQAASGAATLCHFQLQQGRDRLALVSFEDYLQLIGEALERIEFPQTDGMYNPSRLSFLEQQFDKRLPLFPEYFRLLEAVLRHTDESQEAVLFNLFQRLMELNFGGRPRVVRDVVRLITRELFTLTITAFLRRRRYTEVNHLLSRRYRMGGVIRTYGYHAYGPEDLDRQGEWEHRLSVRAWTQADVPENEGLQAEMVLTLWSRVNGDKHCEWPWNNLSIQRYGTAPLFLNIDSSRTAQPLVEIFGQPLNIILERLSTFALEQMHLFEGRWTSALNREGLDAVRYELKLASDRQP